MSYLKNTLDEICVNFCPICGECEQTHLCINMLEIRDRIIKIMTDEIDDS